MIPFENNITSKNYVKCSHEEPKNNIISKNYAKCSHEEPRLLGFLLITHQSHFLDNQFYNMPSKC